MVRKLSLLIVASLAATFSLDMHLSAQSDPDIHVTVNMVQLNVAVTDKKGNYITGLNPKDFAIYEDGILEKPATFAEGNEPARNLGDLAEVGPADGVARTSPERPQTFNDLISGANVFVLFDTSDYMYRGFVFA